MFMLVNAYLFEKKLNKFRLYISSTIQSNTIQLKMGSGISITQEQTIDIVDRELAREFQKSENEYRTVDDYGFILPETFNAESEYRQNVRKLYVIKMELRKHK